MHKSGPHRPGSDMYAHDYRLNVKALVRIRGYKLDLGGKAVLLHYLIHATVSKVQ